jgi:hypothetical protein
MFTQVTESNFEFPYTGDLYVWISVRTTLTPRRMSELWLLRGWSLRGKCRASTHRPLTGSPLVGYPDFVCTQHDKKVHSVDNSAGEEATFSLICWPQRRSVAGLLPILVTEHMNVLSNLPDIFLENKQV